MLSIALAALIAGASSGTAPQPSCGQAQAAAGAQLPPNTPAMDTIKAWVEAARTPDDAAFIRLTKERGPVVRGEPDEWLQLKGLLAGLDYCGIKSADATDVALWFFDKNFESFAVAQFKLPAVASDKPEFAGILLTDESPPGAAGPPKLSEPMLIKAVEDRLSTAVAEDRFSGAVLVAKGGHVLFQQAAGFADREARKPNDLNTQFRFGSMGKMFTAIGIMQLVEQGRIDPATPIGRYLPGYPNPDVASMVTVANLLSHSGGTGDIFGPEFDAHKPTLRDLKDYVDLYGKRPLAFVPGSRSDYSNYGFILLGRIIEEVSHLSYDAFIQKNIFDPAGMKATGNLPESTILQHRAVAYTGSGAKLARADDTLPLKGTSAGGGYSTVGDMKRFVDALTSHRILRAETLQQLIDGGVKSPGGEFFPYDFGSTVGAAGRFIGHSGGAPGMSGNLMHFLGSGYTVVVLANRDPGAAGYIANYVVHRLPAK